MLKQTSQEFRAFFLLEFTKQLIKNSKTEAIFELQERLKEQTKLRKQKKKTLSEPIKKLISKLMPQRISKRTRVLKIPEPRLPPHLQYLRPTPTEIEIDLGKLNPFLKDPQVDAIECNGPDENLVVKGKMGTKPTSIILNKEEIDEIIQKISQASKMPVEPGLFRAAVGKMIFSAIISETIGSKFLIKKLFPIPI